MRRRKRKEYALYKGEEIIAIGTAKEIADRVGIKETTVWFYKSPAYKKRNKFNHLMLIEIED